MIKYGQKFSTQLYCQRNKTVFCCSLMPGQQHCFLLHLYLGSRPFTFPMTGMEYFSVSKM